MSTIVGGMAIAMTVILVSMGTVTLRAAPLSGAEKTIFVDYLSNWISRESVINRYLPWFEPNFLQTLALAANASPDSNGVTEPLRTRFYIYDGGKNSTFTIGEQYAERKKIDNPPVVKRSPLDPRIWEVEFTGDLNYIMEMAGYFIHPDHQGELLGISSASYGGEIKLSNTWHGLRLYFKQAKCSALENL